MKAITANQAKGGALGAGLDVPQMALEDGEMATPEKL